MERIIRCRYLVSTLYSCAVRVLICYNLLLVEIFILYYVRMYVALDKIFHVWRHDQDTNSYTDEGRNWGLSLECARTDIMQDTGEGRSKVKHLYFWLMFLWSLLSTFPADGGCINGVPLHMTGNVTASDHAPEAAVVYHALRGGTHHPPPTTHHPDPDLPPACTPLLSWGSQLLLLLPAGYRCLCRYPCRYLVRETRKLVQTSVSS